MPNPSKQISSAGDLPHPGTAARAINRENLLAAVEHDLDLVKELTAEFISSYPALMDHLREAISRVELPEIRSVAHQLEGMLRCFAATHAAAIVASIGAAARQGTVASLPQLWDDLNLELARAKAELESLTAT